jgi:excisionase family DNA binding protein
LDTKYLTVEEAAAYINTGVRFIRRLIAERRIAFHKVGAHVRLAVEDLRPSSNPGGSSRSRAVPCCETCEGRREMANKKGRRGFANVRQPESGKWQARYRGPDGQIRNAPQTFASRRAAERWLSLTETQIMQGEWTDPERAEIKLDDYAGQWITQRPGLRPGTVELYRWLLRKHISPHLGGVELGRLSSDSLAVAR